MATREVFESRWQAAALLLPTVLVSVVFLYAPAVRAFELSLFEVGFGAGEVDFVGLENYRALLTSSEYHLSVLLTVLFAVAVVVGVMIGTYTHRSRRSRPTPSRRAVSVSVSGMLFIEAIMKMTL